MSKDIRQPHPVDIHVGNRVRQRRLALRLSQEKLGDRLGLTFQQIQKYEKGVNRIGSSRLFEIARTLSVPVGFFFEEAPVPFDAKTDDHASEQARAERRELDALLCTRDGLALATAFNRIGNPKRRRAALNVVEAMVDAAPEAPAGHQLDMEDAA